MLDRHSKLILIIALLMGGLARWYQIWANSLWYDEALSCLNARLSATQIITNAAVDEHPFGYYLLLHYWSSFGTDEVALRSLSAFFSLGTILAIYGLGRWLFGKPTALVASVGMAFTPFQVYFAQEARVYSLLVFLTIMIMGSFFYAIAPQDNGSKPYRFLETYKVFENVNIAWLGYVLMSVGGLYAHYFTVFLLGTLHLWLGLNLRQYKQALGRLMLADGAIGLLFLPQLNQALTRTSHYLGGDAWQRAPNILSPLTTLYYLLFAHRTPFPFVLVPLGLFVMLAMLALRLWDSRRSSVAEQSTELALWLCLFVPMAAVMLISWSIRSIYLERSFAIGTPALTLLLARSVTAAPRWSPSPLLAGVLVILLAITLVAHYLTPDPAKPPHRAVAITLTKNFAPGDVSLHLHDASLMPATCYLPQIPQLLADAPQAMLIGRPTHQAFGEPIVTWQTAIRKTNRLWLTVMPKHNGAAQVAILQTMESTYPLMEKRDFGAVQLYLYEVRSEE